VEVAVSTAAEVMAAAILPAHTVVAITVAADTAAPVAEFTEPAAALRGRADMGRRHAFPVPEEPGPSRAGPTPAAWPGPVQRALPMGTGTPSQALAAGTGAAKAGAAVTAGALVGAGVLVGVAGDSALAGVLFGIGHRTITVHGGATTIRPPTVTRIPTSGGADHFGTIGVACA
jgi:hypothetical protein